MRALNTAATLLMAVAMSAQSTGDVLTWKKGANLADTKTYTTPVNSSLFSLNSSGNFALLAQSNFITTANFNGLGDARWSLLGHTHVSADITNGSTGGNGAADAGKVVKFGAGGSLSALVDGDMYTTAMTVRLSNGNGGGIAVSGYAENGAGGQFNTESTTAPALECISQDGTYTGPIMHAHNLDGEGMEMANDGSLDWTSPTGAATTRTNLGLGTLATQNGTFSGTSSGTNTGDQTITNSSNSTTHTVTLSGSGGSVQLAEGSNITLTTTGTGSAGVVTIASTAGGGGTWGSITGTLSNQTDLNTALNARLTVANNLSDITDDAGALSNLGAGGIGVGIFLQTPPAGPRWIRLNSNDTHTLQTASEAVNELVPTQSGNGGKYLTTDGSAVSWGTVPSGAWGSITGTLADQTDLNTALGLKAPLSSPTFTGTPAAPTAAANTNTTQLATTAYVQAELSALGTVATARTGAALAFDVPAVYNSAASPSASSVTVDWTGAVAGTTVKAWFNHSSEPTWPTGITVAGVWHASNPNACTFTYHGSSTASGECVSDQSGAYTNPQTTYFPNVANVPTDFATTGTTAVQVAGLSGVPILAGKLYRIELVLRGSCSSTGGSQFGFFFNTGTDHILRMAGRQDVSGDTYCNITPTSGYNAVNTTHTWWPNNAPNNTGVLRGTIRGGAVNGTMELRAKSVTSGQTTTVFADGSYMIITLLN